MGLFNKKEEKKETVKNFLLDQYFKSLAVIVEGRRILYKIKINEKEHDILVNIINENLDKNKSAKILLRQVYNINTLPIEDDCDINLRKKARQHLELCVFGN